MLIHKLAMALFLPYVLAAPLADPSTSSTLAPTSATLSRRTLDQDLCSAARVPFFLCPSYILFLHYFGLYPASAAVSTRDIAAGSFTTALEARDLNQEICTLSHVPLFLCTGYILFLKAFGIYPYGVKARSVDTTSAPPLIPRDIEISNPLIPRNLGQDLCTQYAVPPLVCPTFLSFLKKFGLYNPSSTSTRGIDSDVPGLIRLCQSLDPLPALCEIVIRTVEGDPEVDAQELTDAVAAHFGTLSVGGNLGPVIPPFGT